MVAVGGASVLGGGEEVRERVYKDRTCCCNKIAASFDR